MFHLVICDPPSQGAKDGCLKITNNNRLEECHVALVRTDILEEHPFLKDPHGVTCQKTTLNMIEGKENCRLFLLLML
jgi:hypothetical protein